MSDDELVELAQLQFPRGEVEFARWKQRNMFKITNDHPFQLKMNAKQKSSH